MSFQLFQFQYQGEQWITAVHYKSLVQYHIMCLVLVAFSVPRPSVSQNWVPGHLSMLSQTTQSMLFPSAAQVSQDLVF
jgi:hypothetical protein